MTPGPGSGPRFRELRGELYAALAASGFGSAYVATAVALRSFGPVPVAVWRGFLAASVLWAIVTVRHWRSRRPDAAAAAGTREAGHTQPRPALRGRLLRLGIISALGGPMFLASMNLSIAHVGPTIASFVAGLYAILAALFGPVLLRERLGARVLVAFAVALAGTALLARLDLGGTDVTGLAWGLAAATSYALYLVLSRRWSAANRLDGIVLAACVMSSTALVLGVPLLLTDPGQLFPASMAPEVILATGWLAFIAGAATVLVLASVRLIPAARSAAFLLLNPITATILAGLLLGSMPSPLQVVGGLLVLVGIGTATLPAAIRPGLVADPSGRSAG